MSEDDEFVVLERDNPSAERRRKQRFGHQQFRGESIGLNFPIIRAGFRQRVTVQDMLVNMD